MKSFRLLLISTLILFNSCSKEALNSNTETDTILALDESKRPAPTAATIYNPIVGKWELGAFKVLCLGAKDTTVYANEKGDFAEFRKTDTVRYIYNTSNATGWSPYKIIDSSRFILGDTMQIIFNDGVRLTTYTKLSNGGAQQWMTYKKVSN